MFGNPSGTTKKAVVPLSVWAVAVGVSMLIFGLLATVRLPNSHPFQHPQEINYLNFLQRLQNLETQINQDTTAYRVVAFGSSLLASAWDRDSNLNARFEKMGLPIRVYRAFYPGANYRFLEDPQLIGFLERTQPDLLCLEDQAFLYETAIDHLVWPRPWLSHLQHTYVHNLNTLKHLVLPEYFPEPGFSGHIPPDISFDLDHAPLDSVIVAQDSLHFEITERTIRRKSHTRKLNRLLRSLSKKGSGITVVNIPRPAPIEAGYVSKESMQQRAKLIERYQTDLGITYWAFPTALPFRYYWDDRHMNGNGRELFSDWLYQRVIQQYNRR